MSKIVLLLAGFVGIYIGFSKLFTKSDPYVNSIELAEKNDLSDYDYFKLSKGVMVPYAIYEQNTFTNDIKEFVYPYVSKSYLDSLYTAFATDSSTTTITDAAFTDWYDKLKTKPKIYIKSDQKEISEETLNNILTNDTLAKDITGVRIASFVDLSDKIKEKLEESGITPENTLFIEQGETPSGSKGLGWFFLIISTLLVIWMIRSFMNAVENA